MFATLVVAASEAHCQAVNEAPRVAHRPSFPYRVWYSANYAKESSWYPNMTLETSGRGDARFKDDKGVGHLNWVYGTQISWNAGLKYWVEHAGLARRTAKPNDAYPYSFIVSGYAVDEWTGSTEEKRRWVVDGLREAKKQNPELFVAMWVAGVDHHVAALAQDGIVDLILVEAYNLTTTRGLGISWQTGLGRMDVAKKYGLESKTVFGFGHVTDQTNWKGGFVWKEEDVRARMAELKERYPQMPGVAFFESGGKDREAYGQVVRMFDRLSGEFWPNVLPLNGTFSLTPQSTTKNRLRLSGNKVTTGASVTIGESALDRAQLWNFAPSGQGRYKIQAPYDSSLILTANSNQVVLQKDTGNLNQLWNLSSTPGGYILSPQSAPQMSLQTNSTSQVLLAPLDNATKKNDQTWALTPEYLPPPLGTTIFTTSQGQGADATVSPNAKVGRAVRFGIANSNILSQARKGYVRFDLSKSETPKSQWVNARFSLTLAQVRDSTPADKVWTFKVYGLRDGATGEDWSDNSITWETAPANDVTSGNGVTTDATPLGSFKIVGKGSLATTIDFSSPQLLKFLRADTNDLATLIIVREEVGTQGKRDNGLHEFAARENVLLASPTLTLTTPVGK